MRWCLPGVALVLAFGSRVVRADFEPVAADGGIVVPNGDGATFVDLDDDGHVDFLTVHPQIFLGTGDATFVAGPTCGPEGAPVVADFDNDGRLDVLRIRDEPVLCLGTDDGTLAPAPDAIEPSPFAGMHHLGAQIAYGGAAADFDGDGWLDFYMSNFEDHLAPDQPSTFVPFPDLFYANDGAGRLEVVGQAPEGLVFQNRGVTIGDYDDDVHPDVYSASYRLNRNLLWDNDAGIVAEVAEARDCLGWGHTISASFGDFDGDLDLDLFVCNFAHPGNPESFLYLNDIATSGRFVEGAHGIEWQESYASVAAADYDADGDLDLFLATVYAGDHGRLYRNAGDGTFVDVTADEGLAGQQEGYGVAWADLDDDGLLDLYVGGSQAQHLFRNVRADTHRIVVEPRGDGVRVDTSAVATRVVVRTDRGATMREVQAGGSGGDRGGSEPALFFGLGAWTGSADVEVRWRTGETCTYAADADTILRVAYDPDDPACAANGTTGTDGGTGDSAADESSSTAAIATSDASTGGASPTTAGEDDSPPAQPETDAGCSCEIGGRTRAGWLLCLVAGAGLALNRPRSRHRPGHLARTASNRPRRPKAWHGSRVQRDSRPRGTRTGSARPRRRASRSCPTGRRTRGRSRTGCS